MSTSLQFTGERFLPECAGEIVYEHWHRYAFAQRLASGRRVLDLACGEGYGSALLAQAGAEVLGIDLAPEVVAHARDAYSGVAGCRFVAGSCAQIPAAAGAFDLIVSFETLEHVDAGTQDQMLREFARVLAPGGLVLLSSPNKAVYGDAHNYHNEFHVHELYRGELADLLDQHFAVQRWYHQKIQCLSAIWAEAQVEGTLESLELEGTTAGPYPGPEATYFLVLLARAPEHLPPSLPVLSLFVDRGETLLARYESAQGELVAVAASGAEQRRALEELVHERDLALLRRDQHIGHLELLKTQCETVVAERDAQLAGANAHVLHLEDLVARRDALVNERDAQVKECEAQIATLTELLRQEQQAHARMVLELRESLRVTADLNRTLHGLEAERTILVREVEEQVRRLAEREKEAGELREMLVQKNAVVLYRQSFRWWLRLPLARLKMALRKP
ncbi:MAG: methyltransferase domain-containing protein [Betaproteobacteria bacterium]|nr:methyltransferase domain-containing protein [Betaproteobacteria bacterium]